MVSISERYAPWTLTPYEKWVSDEGLVVHTQQLVLTSILLKLHLGNGQVQRQRY